MRKIFLKTRISCKIPKFAFSEFHENPKDFTSEMEFTSSFSPLKLFRVIDLDGKIVADKFKKSVSTETLLKIYQTMVKCEEMDLILEMAQRQGCVTGSAAALEMEDIIFPQYREQAALLWRGFTIKEVTDQCAGNVFDPAKGRQMPVHYGSKKLNVATISSPLATQIPQASGAGYSFRIKGEKKVAATYFGEGSASEGDFHAALNFAATLSCQTLFLCRNNRYAISTPLTDQYAGDGIAGRGMAAYGIRSLRVDGNDTLASYLAVKEARRFILEEKKPCLIEFMTYRVSFLNSAFEPFHLRSFHSLSSTD